MREEQQIIAVVLITLVIGAAGVVLLNVLPGAAGGIAEDLVIDEYQADLYDNGTLVERYTYAVRSSGQYRMLFRNWVAPLTFDAPSTPHIQYVRMNVPSGVVGYVKDADGNVWVSDNTASSRTFVADRAFESEVGIYNPQYFEAGTYTVEYVYTVAPPIEYDETNDHVNLRLADEHVPYRNIRFNVHSDSIEAAYPYPPALTVERTDDGITITGSAAANEVLGADLLFASGYRTSSPGFPQPVEDVRGKTEQGHLLYSLPYTLASVLSVLAQILALATPFLLYLLYRRYGAEKRFVVPKYLSYVPNPSLKPWIVNLLFEGNADTFNENGFYATLLDLHRQRAIEITEKPDGKGVMIHIFEAAEGSDPYEKRVLSFLRELAADGDVDTGALTVLANQAKKDSAARAKVLRFQAELGSVTHRTDPTVTSAYIVDGRWRVLPIAAAGAVVAIVSVILFFVASYAGAFIIPAIIASILVIIEAGVAFAFPPTLFGRWKGDFYKE
ncbi:MAG: DUF2207 domain-containing protein, partial [Methanobacteriota archaeon]